MGLLDRFFKTDPRQALERAENLLARGQAAEALRMAERALKSASLAQNNRAETLVRRAKDALVDAAVEKADLAEESGFPEDAAEWIEGALHHAEEGRRADLEGRAAALLGRAEEERVRRERPDFPVRAGAAGPSEPGVVAELDHVFDADDQYDALVSLLDDDVAVRYDDRPEAFRRAFMLLSEGRPAEARTVLEELADADPEDPVHRFERGRCRLETGDFEGARQDFEAVWETFGDEPLDTAQTYSVPGLWAEAVMKSGKFGEVLERLDEVAVPGEADGDLCYYYALALMATKRFDVALAYLLAVTERHTGGVFSRLLAAALHALGRTPEAIDVLERAVAPSCSPGGGCRTVPKDAESLHALVGLYLDAGEQLPRVEELLTHLAQARSGRLAAEDYLLLAEYHRQRGDAEAAREASAEARRLREALGQPAR